MQLMSEDLDTLWQSDGSQPHMVNIHFPRRTPVTHVSIYLDCHRDDSYTPTKILVKAGSHPYDLVDVRYREFLEPQGWFHFVLAPQADMEAEEFEASPGSAQATQALHPIDIFVLQICILGNHLNGKDTHIRCIKIFGPPGPSAFSLRHSKSMEAPLFTERLVQQGMKTEAFRRQVERVGYERAVAQLQRIMKQNSHKALESTSSSSSSSTAQRSLMTLSQTLR
ncbi:anaphase-promoting complex protein [Malassezia pachydermatis]